MSNAELFRVSFLRTFHSLRSEAAAVDRAMATIAGSPQHSAVEAGVVDVAMALLGHVILADDTLHARERALLEALGAGDRTSEATACFAAEQCARRPNLLREIPSFLDTVITLDLDEGRNHALRLVTRLDQLGHVIAAADGVVGSAEADALQEWGQLLLAHLERRGIAVGDS